MSFVQTFAEYVRLTLQRRKRRLLGAQGKCVLHIDNRFKRHFDQIAPFFDSGFFDARDTVVLSKFYMSSFAYTLAAARARGIKVVFYNTNAQIPVLDGKYIFYPYNSQSNARLVLNRKAVHVFLTHGDSNKKASINRLARIYDHVLACGDIAVDRYLEYGVFSEDDIRRNRVIRVGDAAISGLPDGMFSARDVERCLLYMPTWEGGLDDEDFSSAAHPQTGKILIYLCRKLGVKKLLLKAHPNLGARRRDTLKGLTTLLAEAQTAGIEVASLNAIAGIKPYRMGTWFPVRGVVDVSAAEAMLAASGISSFVLYRPEKEIFAPDSYLKMRNRAMINLDDPQWQEKADGYIGSAEEEQDQAAFAASLISCASQAVAALSRHERLDWLLTILSPAAGSKAAAP